MFSLLKTVLDIFKVPGYGAESQKNSEYDNRIIDLIQETSVLEKKLAKVKEKTQQSPWDKFLYPETECEAKIETYNPFLYKDSSSMKELLEKRVLEEKERIKKLESLVSALIEETDKLINKEKVDDAERCLLRIAYNLKSIQVPALEQKYYALVSRHSALKEELKERKRQKEEEDKRLLQEEKERREKEEKERQLLERLAEEERIRKAREYEERLRKEERERNEEIERLGLLSQYRKDESDEILTYLRRNNVLYFFHFTDVRNIPSIKRNKGLYSWKYCEEHDIRVSHYGGDSFSRSCDMRQGLDDYVRLSFCDDHPMAFRLHSEGCDLVLLKIKIDVATFEGTLFSNKNAAATSHRHGGMFANLKDVNISATKQNYVSKSSPIFEDHQAECLIKTFLPIEYIVNIDHPSKMLF